MPVKQQSMMVILLTLRLLLPSVAINIFTESLLTEETKEKIVKPVCLLACIYKTDMLFVHIFLYLASFLLCVWVHMNKHVKGVGVSRSVPNSSSFQPH